MEVGLVLHVLHRHTAERPAADLRTALLQTDGVRRREKEGEGEGERRGEGEGRER